MKDDGRAAPRPAPEWVHETFGAAALELGLYEEAEAPREEAAAPVRRPAWLEME